MLTPIQTPYHQPSKSPCTDCGACCATYRVSFYWAEINVNQIPDQYTEQLTQNRACMTGTNNPNSRCIALEGNIGEHVSCKIYEHRPSPCHELQAGEDKCTRARAKHGLPPLTNAETLLM